MRTTAGTASTFPSISLSVHDHDPNLLVLCHLITTTGRSTTARSTSPLLTSTQPTLPAPPSTSGSSTTSCSTTKPWKILMFHEPGWNAGTHTNNVTAQLVFDNLVKMYNVDLVYMGHSHNYARCQVNNSAMANGDSIVPNVPYVTSGAGGAPLDAIDKSNTGSWRHVVTAESVYQYETFNIQGKTLTMNVYKIPNASTTAIVATTSAPIETIVINHFTDVSSQISATTSNYRLQPGHQALHRQPDHHQQRPRPHRHDRRCPERHRRPAERLHPGHSGPHGNIPEHHRLNHERHPGQCNRPEQWRTDDTGFDHRPGQRRIDHRSALVQQSGKRQNQLYPCHSTGIGEIQ